MSPPAMRTHSIYVSCQSVTGKLYSDPTGRFLVPTSKGNQYLLFVYDYDSNFIFAEPMKSSTGAEHLAAFKRVQDLLKRQGLKPKLQKLDNEVSKELLQFSQDEDIDYQVVPPKMHQRNAAERAIRTFKNHFISTLCGTDPNFPLHLWDRLLPQTLLTLNLLRASRINPRLSAQAQVHGAFDYNCTPLGPPGTLVLVHDKPETRETWAPHAVEAWYIGPAMDHYCCFTVYIIETKLWPGFPNMFLYLWHPLSLDLATAAARDLTNALLHPTSASSIARVSDSQSTH
jgi:hypothetical protein